MRIGGVTSGDVALSAVLASLATGCAHYSMDRGNWQGAPATATLDEVPVKGFSVSVSARNGHPDVHGELIAVNSDMVYVEDEEGLLSSLEMNDVDSITVEMYSGETGMYVLWTVGTLSTLSHGAYLLFTAPTWIATGISSGVAAGRMASIRANRDRAWGLWQFARFPAGLPKGFVDASASAKESR
jgi:hypothetical protein